VYAWFGPAHGWRLLGRGPVSGLVAGPGLAVGVPSVPAPCSQPFPQPGDILLAEPYPGKCLAVHLVQPLPASAKSWPVRPRMRRRAKPISTNALRFHQIERDVPRHENRWDLR
jgi:hypothetical protein